MDSVALSNGLHGSVQMDSLALFSWIGWLRHRGILTEAALQVNGVFEAAQKACEQYIDNIKNLSKRQETICEQKMKECEQQTQKMLKDAQIECDMMRAKAKVDAESYWSEVHSRLENFYKEYNELQKILPIKDQ